MNKLPDGWEETEEMSKWDGKPIRIARTASKVATVRRCDSGLCVIEYADDLRFVAECEVLGVRLLEAVAIARQWDEESGAK